MTSDELNEWFANNADRADDKDFYIKGLSGVSGKVVPYYGWGWRFIDFDGVDTLGWDGETFIGFMGNNKWGYASYWLTREEMAQVRERSVQLATGSQTEADFQSFFDYLQTFKPKLVKQD